MAWGAAVFLVLQFIFRVDVEALTPYRLCVQRLDHLICLQSLLGENKEVKIRLRKVRMGKQDLQRKTATVNHFLKETSC